MIKEILSLPENLKSKNLFNFFSPELNPDAFWKDCRAFLQA